MKKLKLVLITGGLLFASMAGFAQANKKGQNKTHQGSTKTPHEVKLESKIDSMSYALGISISTNLKKQGFDTLNPEILGKAIGDAYKKTGKFDEKEAQAIVMSYYQNLQSGKAEKNLKAGQKFLEENKKKPGVVTLPSGLQYMVLKEGNGPKPTATDKVTTHYHGTLIDGTVFDSSVERGQPATFPVNGVIKGWVEALQLMPVGSKWRLFIPSDLAYGEQGAGGSIGPNSALIFDVELISIEGK
jgi:FKBP-type peptidyl-prolyl cis-trans isomerase FklB